MLIDGELAMDDRGHFLIQVSSGEDSYIMFDDTVQLGMPEADAWIDDQEKLHIVVRDVRTARYRVTDFTYDSEKKNLLEMMCSMEMESIIWEQQVNSFFVQHRFSQNNLRKAESPWINLKNKR